MPEKGEIVIYRAKDKTVQLKVKLERDTVWLAQKQIAELFQKDVRTVNEHILNIFKEKELEQESTIRKFRIVQYEGSREIVRNIDFYNLDVIISVGYRVKSQNGTRFRIWATNVLKKHLIDGYTINEQRLQKQIHKLHALQRAIKLIGSMKERKELEYGEALGLIEVIKDYNYALELLDDYDYKKLKISQTSKEERFKLTYDNAIKAVHQLDVRFGGSDLFGREKDNSFKSSIASIYQTFGGKELYPSVEEKAANLLYFIVKNHSFVDGNKRIADNALVALTLMIAESNPSERDIIVVLAVNLINRNN